LNYEQFYKPYFRKWKIQSQGKEALVNCPFHDDKNPSMSINLENGLWNCFGCGKGGDIYTFYQEKHQVGFKEAKRAIDEDDSFLPPKFEVIEEKEKEDLKIENEVVKKLEEQLWANAIALEFLREERGLSDKTIKKFKIGYNQGRITFPIFDEIGTCRNIRQYSKKDKSGKKVISWKTGYGKARIFPIKNLKAEEILFCEGEMDCILANQLGYFAITVTGGAGTWKQEWNELFKGKTINICYDIDKAGQSGADKIARELYGKTKQIKIIHLPLTEPPNADFTNYIIDNGHSKEDFDCLIAKTKPYNLAEAIEKDEKIYDVHLSQASYSKYYNQKVRIKAVVAGKDLAPYIVPSEVKFTCNMGKKTCEFCGLGISGGEKEIKILKINPDLLLFLDTSKDTVKGYLKRLVGIPGACHSSQMEILKTMNIENLLLIPELDWSAEDQDYVTRRSFYVGHGLKSGRSYEFTALTVPEPKSQYATHLIFEKQTATDDVSAFEISNDLKKELKIFQPKENQSVEEKMNEIAKDLSVNITQIYGRNDLHIAIDLVYHSALSFDFLGKFIRKGWLELLVLGDTRCVSGDTIIFTENGIKPIVNCKKGEKISTVSGVKSIEQFHSFKKEKTIKIKTKRGLILEGTFDHPVLTPKGFVELAKLKIGDYVAIQVGSNLFGKNKLGKEKARLLGYFIGDGYLNYKRGNFIRMTIFKRELDIIDDFENCLQKLNIDFKKYLSRNCWDYWISRKYFNLPFCKAESKEVPGEIMTSGKFEVVEFLKGLFETDGHHAAKGSIEYYSKSYKLVKQIQLLLLNLGVLSTIRKKIVKGIDYYRLGIFGNAVDVFFEEIGFISSRKNKRKNIMHKSTSDVIPETHCLVNNVWSKYKEFHPEIKKRNSRLNGFSINTIRQWRYGNRRPQKKTLRKFLDFAIECKETESYKQLELLASSNISYDKISDISYSKNCVYDLTIPLEHNFITNGFISHNTGKTEVAQRLIEHYKLGEFVTGESSSYAGLVGGMQQNQKRWSITWGKIPLNDKRLVVIDEASGLTEEAIGNMSGVRSSGIAEITKIQTERTNARTRLVWISNPRENMDLRSRTYPVVFLRNLIGRPEDIARFDFVVTCASGEVPSEIINSAKHKKVKHQYTSELCKDLILWVWSRKHTHIHFEKEAIDCILHRAIEFGETYSSAIPLVEAADVRMKIAKLSMATAARLFSTEDGENLKVKKEHVEFVCNFLEQLFKKPTLKYYQFSYQQMKQKKKIAKNKIEIKRFLQERPNLLDFLEQYDYFSEKELEMSLGLEKEERKEISTFLFKNRLVRRTTRGVKKSPEFIELVNEILEGGEEKNVYNEDSLPF